MKHLFYFLLCIFASLTVTAQNQVTISNPLSWSASTTGIITDPIVEITPAGAYAAVDFTFTINAQSSYNSADNLEAVLKFDLPNNSYIHDSWLWLDNNTIIRAAIIEKNRAISIYNGIVIRKRDPSLLLKTGPNSYQLSVYPLRTNYARKVKISYSVPFNWRNNRASVPLPIGLLGASQTLPDLSIAINYNSIYSNPALTEKDINNFTTGNSGIQYNATIPSASYTGKDAINVNYTVNMGNKPMLSTYSVSPTESIYQLIIPSGTINQGTRNIVFILDHFSTNSIYTLNEVKAMLRSSMLNDYNSTDSFNLFYADGNSIIKAYPSWHAMDQSSIDNVINSIPSAYTNNGTQYESMLKMAISFCQSKPGSNSQMILLSSNVNYSTNQSTVDALFNNIKLYVGSFTNKINVINYTTSSYYTSSGYLRGNEILYNKLTLASDGAYYKYQTSSYVYSSGKYTYSYDLNTPNSLNNIAQLCGTQTNAYSINIGVAGGFAHSRYTLNGVNKLNFNSAYVETGKVTGAILAGSTIQIQALANGNMINSNFTMSSILSGSGIDVKSWNYRHIEELSQLNSSVFTKEIIDSSINNRVLCNYTAFLALETGDTINTNKNDNPSLTGIDNIPNNTAADLVKCYPNPFSESLTITFAIEAEGIEIYDMTGRKVYQASPNKNDRSFIWNGADNNGNALTTGIYIITIKTATDRISIKVNKQ